MKILQALVCLVVVLNVCSSVDAADKNKKHVYLSPDKAGSDYQIQGEYQGVMGENIKMGAQVIARGDGQFDAVLYQGGLPGSGWDGMAKVLISGKTDGEKTVLTGTNYRGKIHNAVFAGTADEGVPFYLKKVKRKSPTLGAKPPEGSIVLFDGTNVDSWNNAKIEDGHLLGIGVRTKKKFKDYTLHLEFRLPFMPTHRGQGRGNSGMYLSDQYECQVLDSFGLNGENNECGGFYKIKKPDVNMCYPPLRWQTYDVEFQAAKFNDKGKKTAPAVVTIRHNGVLIHDKFELPTTTPGGGQADEKPGALFFQNHGDPVRYRNVWIKEN